MSYSASELEDILDEIHRNNGKRITKDQAGLLAKEDSWIHQLRKKPHGVANVPNHVLETVTAAHEAAVRQRTSSEKQPAKAASPNVAVSSQPCAKPRSSPERFIPDWSVSPDARRPRREDMPESSFVEETPHPQHARAPYRKAPLDWKAPLDKAPMSSLEEEEELDVQLPLAENVQHEAVAEGHYKDLGRYTGRRIQDTPAQMTNTPPCAQPDHEVIPATVGAEISKRTRDDGGQRRVKRFKPYHMDSPINSKGSIMAVRDSRMPSLKHLEVTETQETAVSSSIVPATLTQTQTQNATNMPKETHQDVSAEIDTGSSAEEAESLSPEVLSARERMSDDEDLEDDEDCVSTPLAEFCGAYPEYCKSHSGTRLSFVKACLCLDYLRRERALRDYLYDEFIRLFSFEYLDYVNGAGPDQEPLSAIEWFNMQSGEPLYTRHIVKNDNLDRVLTFYEEEAVSIRSVYEQQKQDGSTGAGVAPGATELGSASPARLPQKMQQIMEVDVREMKMAEGAATDKSTPKRDRIQSERPISQAVSPSKSVCESESRPVSRQAVSVARSAPIRRAESPEMGRRTTLRAAIPPSSMRSNAPVGTQYMQQLSTRQSSTGEDAAQKRREKVRAAMRKRASASARSASSKAGSVV